MPHGPIATISFPAAAYSNAPQNGGNPHSAPAGASTITTMPALTLSVGQVYNVQFTSIDGSPVSASSPDSTYVSVTPTGSVASGTYFTLTANQSTGNPGTGGSPLNIVFTAAPGTSESQDYNLAVGVL